MGKGTVVAAGGVAAVAASVVVQSRSRGAEGVAARIVTGASRLLPADAEEEYREEWAAWMLDLRADGTPPVHRWVELLSIVLIAAPRLAITLRLAARRAVDR
ncbi:hypothetical protein [Saccharothrix syringae]|uniref:Uncharacterized protein n=1 Tax=Saccharothrix syringae TaxID=103733 RepID=A0A5Q0GXZ6_SACSY|nr:hypothetical protein [Saccharothrix syringae]QFZ18819.1 hypothetical protein EKG83_16395 [Saccharothrix syringae]